jgi:predicted AAA+ superfamily ATPase
MRNKKGKVQEITNKFLRRMRESIEMSDPWGENIDNIDTQTPTKWSILQNETFAPSYVSIPQVPPGLYEILWNSNLQTHVLVKQKLNIDELYELPSPEIQSILGDIQLFWDKKEVYKKYNFVHKRGILMWGEPGCGKSGIIQLCVKKLIENENGIVINIKEEEDFKNFVDFIPTLRKIEPERPLIVILEDIDALASEDRYSTTKLLNILDGVKQIENVVYIATTNYPEKLQERITNRPSRFDRRYKVEMPSEEIRRSYIKNKLSESDLSKIDIEKWVKETDNMSLSHLKELIVTVIVMGRDFEEAIQNLTEMKKSPSIKKGGGLGFNK